jgi:L-threonylcarbamoyladenylate synthase
MTLTLATQTFTYAQTALAAEILRSGKLLAIPTETVYGLAANAYDAAAVAQVFEAKKRPSFDPLIVHVARSWSTLSTLDAKQIIDLSRLNDLQRRLLTTLIEKFWPGPLTLLMPKGSKIPDLVTSGLTDVGVRMPHHAVTEHLLEQLQLPLAAPSANRFGRISPTRADHVMEELGGSIHGILDGGPCLVGLESTVASVGANGHINILRPGKIASEEIADCLEQFNVKVTVTSTVLDHHNQHRSPGQLASHYAPKKPCYIARNQTEFWELIAKLGQSFSFIAIASRTNWTQSLSPNVRPFMIESLSFSEKGTPIEVASHLFERLRQADHNQDSHAIIAEFPIEESGLWLAIRDRLVRASQRS